MRGTIEAASHEQAGELLTDMQLTVNEITKAVEKPAKTAVGRNEFLMFNQQLASITKAGIPLEKGLRELAKEAGSRSMRKLITDIVSDLEQGLPIDAAIEKRQKYFPALYGRILKAGVETGRLSEMLTSLNRHLEVSLRTRRLIIESMCYPAVVLAIAAVILTGMLVFIVPAFGEVLAEMTGGRGRLPGLTVFFLTLANNISQIWIGIFLAIGVIFVGWTISSASPSGRRFKESVFLSLPIVGRLYHRSILARMSEAMGMLIAAGCQMSSSLRMSAGASGSEKMKFECEMLAGQLEEGEGIIEAGQSCQMLPGLFLYSVQLGAQRNELQHNLYSLSEMYSEQTNTLQCRLQGILPPIMIILLGLMIGTMITAMFLPMISMVSAMM